MRKTAALFLAASLLAAAACRETALTQPASTLPAGDPVAGKQVFQEMRCWSCHEINGGGMPKPEVNPPVAAYLGGNQIPPPDALYLVRAIVDPSHELAPGWAREQMVTPQGTSRMLGYGDALTARQLFDLIAFLQSRYGPDADAAAAQRVAPAN